MANFDSFYLNGEYVRRINQTIFGQENNNPLNNNDATSHPLTIDDSTKGYSVGSIWTDTTTSILYMCVDATENAAVWKPVSDADKTCEMNVIEEKDINHAVHNKLISNEIQGYDQFGRAVAIDGDYVVVGAIYEHDGDVSDAGAAYVYVKTGNTWAQQQKLEPTDPDSFDHFGTSVAISGDTIVIGATGDDDTSTNAGAVYVFVRSGTTWSLQQKLQSGDAASYEYFGNSVSIDGDYIAVGAYDDNDGDTEEVGACFIFVRSGTTWTQQQKLVGSDSAVYDVFGGSVSISGSTVAVGAQGDDDTAGSSGSVYVFTRSGTTWTQQQKLVAGDAAAYNYFGNSISVSGDYLVVGAYGNDNSSMDHAGAAYVFVRSGSAWSQQQKLTSDDPTQSDYYGYSVFIDGSYIVVGCVYDDDSGSNSGSAHVYVRSGSTWSQQQKLSPNDASEYDRFGNSVCISGDNIAVGAPYNSVNGTEGGSAYVFLKEDDEWEQVHDHTITVTSTSCTNKYVCSGASALGNPSEVATGGVIVVNPVDYSLADTIFAKQHIYPSDGSSGDLFGTSVSTNGHYVVVGAPGKSTNTGAGYVYLRSNYLWNETALTPSGLSMGDLYGTSVAISRDTMYAAVSAPGDDTNSGKVYIWSRSGSTWTNDTSLTSDDVSSGDNFGSCVVMSDDGTYLFVSAQNKTSNQGAVYVFKRTGDTWVQFAKMVLASPSNNDYFGSSLSTHDGSILAVGSTGIDSNKGKVYIYERTLTGFVLTNTLSGTSTSESDKIGSNVSITDDNSYVSIASVNKGTLEVYSRNGTGWASLKVFNDKTYDKFVNISSNGALLTGIYNDGNDKIKAITGYTFKKHDDATKDIDAGIIKGMFMNVEVSVPASSQGAMGDKKGYWSKDSNYFYKCIEDHNGTTNIWVRERINTWVTGVDD